MCIDYLKPWPAGCRVRVAVLLVGKNTHEALDDSRAVCAIESIIPGLCLGRASGEGDASNLGGYWERIQLAETTLSPALDCSKRQQCALPIISLSDG